MTFANVSLQLIATGAIAGGVTEAIKGNYIGGGIAILAGLIAYVIYEKMPASTPPQA